MGQGQVRQDARCPIYDFNHLMDAMRYALEKYIINKKWTY